jgi:hypothetical protein
VTGIPTSNRHRLSFAPIAEAAPVRSHAAPLAAIADTPPIFVTVSIAHVYTDRVSASTYVNAAPDQCALSAWSALSKYEHR